MSESLVNFTIVQPRADSSAQARKREIDLVARARDDVTLHLREIFIIAVAIRVIRAIRAGIPAGRTCADDRQFAVDANANRKSRGHDGGSRSRWRDGFD